MRPFAFAGGCVSRADVYKHPLRIRAVLVTPAGRDFGKSSLAGRSTCGPAAALSAAGSMPRIPASRCTTGSAPPRRWWAANFVLRRLLDHRGGRRRLRFLCVARTARFGGAIAAIPPVSARFEFSATGRLLHGSRSLPPHARLKRARGHRARQQPLSSLDSLVLVSWAFPATERPGPPGLRPVGGARPVGLVPRRTSGRDHLCSGLLPYPAPDRRTTGRRSASVAPAHPIGRAPCREAAAQGSRDHAIFLFAARTIASSRQHRVILSVYRAATTSRRAYGRSINRLW